MTGLDGLVSVIMPAYNAERFISQAIESVRSQTYKNWELIVCDDQSSDRTRSIIAEFVRFDPRISQVQSVRNAGPGHARNLAIAEGRGRWLAFLDSDDVWDREKLRNTLAHAERCGSALTFTAYQRISEDGSRAGRTIRVPSSVTYRQLLRTNVIATSTVLIDRFKISNFQMVERVFFDDFIAWLQITKEGHKTAGLSAVLTKYRTRKKSFSSNKIRSARKVIWIYRNTESLNTIQTAWYLLHYTTHGILKHLIK